MYDKQKVIALALSQVGYHEKASNADLDSFTGNSGGNNWNKYARDLDEIRGFYNGPKNIGRDGAWCDIFIDWLFVKSYGVLGAKELLCQPDNSAGAGCLYSARYFMSKGRFREKGPETGDQIFFTYQEGEVSHTGLVVEVTDYSVVTVEGNTSDGVYKRSYPLSDARIYGYGRPDWDARAADPEPVEPEPEKPKLTGLPMLRQGDTGEIVRAAQILLNGRGASVGKWGADGDFGPMTREAVLAFQRRNGIEADGIIGPITWAELLGVRT